MSTTDSQKNNRSNQRESEKRGELNAGSTLSNSPVLVGRISRRQFLLRNAAAVGAAAFGEVALGEGEPQVTRYRLAIAGLREPVRMVQLSDLHRSWCVSEAYLRRVVTQTNALQPHAALLTGDFVTDSSTYMDSCCRVLKELNAPLGSFAVLGNHDHACDRHRGGPVITEALEGLGVRVLTNDSFRLGNRLNIIGIDDFTMGRPDPDQAFSGVRREEPGLVLTHNPMLFPWLEGTNYITVAGHTHGGQINVPVVTRSLMRRKHRYLKGWFHARTGPGKMYVSRGVGVVGIPIRLRCDPEITLFELFPA